MKKKFLSAFVLLPAVVLLLDLHVGLANARADVIKLDPNAPALPSNPTPIDILGFAASSLRWALEDHPDDGGKKDISTTEWQLIEALHYLDKVPDTPDDKAAKAQQLQRENAAWKALLDAFEDPTLKKAKEGVWKTVLEPTIAGDGQGPTRDVLKAQIVTALYNYRMKGLPTVDPLKSLIDAASEPPSPQWQNASPSEHPDFEEEFQGAEAIRRTIKAERDRIFAERKVLIDQTAKINPAARVAQLKFQQAWAARKQAEETAPSVSITSDGESVSFRGFGAGSGPGEGNGTGESLFTFIFGG